MDDYKDDDKPMDDYKDDDNTIDDYPDMNISVGYKPYEEAMARKKAMQISEEQPTSSNHDELKAWPKPSMIVEEYHVRIREGFCSIV